MTDHNDWTTTPEEAYLAIEGGFFGVLGERVAGRVNLAELGRNIRACQAEIEGRHASWVEDEQSTFHLRFAALALAGYRALLEVLPGDEALALVRDALIEPSRPWMLSGTEQALDHAPDPFALMTGISKEKEADFYGRTFAFERPQDDEHAYLLNITRCFWYRFFAENGAPELMPAFCDFDTNWMDAVDPGRHGFRAERPTTLGYSGDTCRFWFIRSSSTRASADGDNRG